MLFGTALAQNETESAAPPSKPCEQEPAFREFDFWLGEWEVRAESGARYGINHITRERGGCVLVERWESDRGGTGISLNYVDPASQRWVQNWVGSGGTIIDIRGGLKDGSMLLEGTIQYVSSGQSNAFRGLWTPLEDGRVRQFFEESTDGGKTWQAWFEGFYSRIRAPNQDQASVSH